MRKSIKVGDLVRNLNSESGMSGVIIGWTCRKRKVPRVLWADGRCSWIMAHRISVIL